MARIRSVKPEFFLDDELGRLIPLVRLFFVGLWVHADRLGRLKDRPAILKVQICPYDDIDPEVALAALSPKFITRYEVDGRRFIQINTFGEHQRPHLREAESTIPEPPARREAQPRQCQGTTKAMSSPLDKGKGMEVEVEVGREGGKGIAGDAPRATFKRPAIEEVRAYCLERRNTVDAERWFAHYESNGWRVGRNAMKDWRAAVRTWERNENGGGFDGAGRQGGSGRVVGAAAPVPGKYSKLTG